MPNQQCFLCAVSPDIRENIPRFFVTWGKIRGMTPSLPVGSVWLSHGRSLSLGPASSKQLIDMITAMKHLVQCFRVLMAVAFYPCVVVHCTSSAVVDQFVRSGTSKRYPKLYHIVLQLIHFFLMDLALRIMSIQRDKYSICHTY